MDARFVGRGLIERCDAKEMLACQHSGFPVDAGVCIEARDRAALERLLRYCGTPPFAMDRLRKEGAALVYRCAKQHSEPAHRKSLSRSMTVPRCHTGTHAVEIPIRGGRWLDCVGRCGTA